MSISLRSLRRTFAPLSCAAFLIASLASVASAYPTVSGLPEPAVTGIQSSVPFTGPTGPTYSTFTVSSPATGPVSLAGSLPNNPNPYGAWCSNPYSSIQNSPEAYSAYSSYDPNFLALPGTGTATAWAEINWVINHKHGNSGTLTTTTADIQNVIWNLLVPGYTPLSAAAQQLYTDATTYGPNFMPTGGQLLAVALYAGGINPATQTPFTVQDLFVEYLLPTTPQTPGIKITKTASVGTAKCADAVTYTYTVTNTGNVPLTNVTVVDDNATPNYQGDDVTIASGVTLQPGQSQTYTRTLYLPSTQYGVDAYGNSANHTLVTQVLPNGNIQVTLLEDQNIVDNSYGIASSPDWGSQGNNPWNHLGQDSAEFQFVDGNGNVVLDFAADYVSFSPNYPSGIGTAGIYGGAGHLFSGSASNIVSIDTTITDNFNQNGNVGNWYFNSPPPNYPNWKFQCGYTVVIKPSCFGRYGYGGCNIKKIQHGQCKTGGSYQCVPTPICKTVTNTVTATGTANVNGTNLTVTSNAQASVQLTPGGQQSCQTPPTCKCTCWNCQHGDHQHCQNTQCHDDGCKQQQCQQQQQQRCAPQPCNSQVWWRQCNQRFQQCGGRPW